MRYGRIVLLMLFSSAVAARVSAQAPVFDSFTPLGTKPDDVVARMLSFDRDGDGRIVASELPERMQRLITEGDANKDGALDGGEVRTLALRPAATATVRGFQPGSYGFGDEIGVSSRAHIEGALDDLRLSPESHQQALSSVRAFMDAVEADASAKLIADLNGVLSPTQLAEVKSALDSPDSLQTVTIVSATRDGRSTVHVAMRGGLEQRVGLLVAQYAVELPQKRAALGALDAFKARVQVDESDRAVLMKSMMTVLTDEERDNFRAALDRRPLVKSGVTGFAGLIDSGVLNLRGAPVPGAR